MSYVSMVEVFDIQIELSQVKSNRTYLGYLN